ncbi:MAG: hypothetical protein HYX54_00790 [Chloroflexi bacterium]|nr:hypothetical protein [Chloroflexota bacterium]
MRSRRKVLVVLGAIVAFGVLAPTVSANSTPTPLHLVKDCGTFGATRYCTIAVSNLDVLPLGTKIRYTGPVLDNAYFLSSNVIADAGKRGRATGYCIFDGKASTGLCTFWGGSGTLAGFNAILDVTVDSLGLFHLDGMYYFADVATPPDTSTEEIPRARPSRASQRMF